MTCLAVTASAAAAAAVNGGLVIILDAVFAMGFAVIDIKRAVGAVARGVFQSGVDLVMVDEGCVSCGFPIFGDARNPRTRFGRFGYCMHN